MPKIVTNNEQETFLFGFSLAKKLKGGEVLALSGDLGAGKTKLIQGLAKGLGVRDKINSPTFNILKIYQIKQKIGQKKPIKFFCHIDAYRLNSGRDLSSLGAEEFFGNLETITAIEWAEKVKEILPKKTKIIKIKSLSEQQREIRV